MNENFTSPWYADYKLSPDGECKLVFEVTRVLRLLRTKPYIRW
jgi:hypothetical protein